MLVLGVPAAPALAEGAAGPRAELAGAAAALPAGVVAELTASDAATLAAALPTGAEPATRLAMSAVQDGTLEVSTLEVAAADAAVAQAVLEGQPSVVATALDRRDVTPAAFRTDSSRYRQWALDRLQAETVWDLPHGVAPVVAVLDTGIDATHPDLDGVLVAGTDVVYGGDGRTDFSGHGTHVAGILAAEVGNGTGIAGLLPDAQLMPVRVFGYDGVAWGSDVAKGIVWAVDHGARVLNLSLGGTTSDPVQESAVRYAEDHGAVVVAAMGNDATATNAVSYPAAYPTVLAVGSTDANDARSAASSTGAHIDLAAPGSNIYSTYLRKKYTSLSGTSMATPYAAATAALVLGAWPALTPAQVREHLERTADDLGAPGFDDGTGYGLVDPVAALTSQPSGVPQPPASTTSAVRFVPAPVAALPAPALPAPVVPAPAPAPVAPAPVVPAPVAPPAPAPVPVPAALPVPGPTAPSAPKGIVVTAELAGGGNTLPFGAWATVRGSASQLLRPVAGTVRLLSGGTVLATGTLNAGHFDLKVPLRTSAPLSVEVTSAAGATGVADLGTCTVVPVAEWTSRSSGKARSRTRFPALVLGAPTGTRVRLEQLVGSTWVERAVARVGRSGKATLVWAPPKGVSVLRVRVPSGAGLGAATTGTRRHTAR